MADIPSLNTFASRFTQPLTGAATAAGVASFTRSQKELNYKAYVVCADLGILVEAWMPQEVGTSVSANYEAPYAQGVSGQIPDSIGAMARFMGMSMTTQALTVQVWQGGSFIDFTIPFVFQSDQNAPAVDVMTPIKNLMKLIMPVDSAAAQGGGGILQAPGPHIDPGLAAKNGVTAAGDILSSLGGLGSGFMDAGKNLFSGNITGLVQGAQNGLNNIAKPISNAIVNSVKNNISLYLGQFMYLPCVVITDVGPTYDVLIGVDNNPIRATVNVGIRTFFMPTASDLETMFPSAQASAVGQSSGTIGNFTNAALSGSIPGFLP